MESSTVWTPYCGSAPDPAAIWGRWNRDPVLLIGLALLGAALAFGLRGAGWKRQAAAALAVVALFVSFVSPLCALSSALFTARTLHHLLLMLVAAPLLALALPRVAKPRLWTTVLLQTAVLWAWHAPAAYGWALSNDGAYWLMQASILGAGLAFWASVRASRAPAAVAALLVAMVQMGLLGAIITFAVDPLYAPHFASTLAWSLTPLEDQQAAGLIMWAPAAAAYLAAALLVLGRMLGPDASRARTA